jgi:predicted esterase
MIADPHAGQPVVSAGAPLGRGAGVVLLLHGRNASPRNILDLLPRLDRADLTYLAPAAADGTWYPKSFMAPRAENEPSLGSALRAVATLVEETRRQGVPPSRLIIGGFSQGACLASEFVCRHSGRCAGLVAFSGGLIGAPGTIWTDVERADGLDVFLGCSDVDAHVPRTRVEETAAAFTRLGATVDLRIYPGMGHLVADDEIAAAQALIARVLG